MEVRVFGENTGKLTCESIDPKSGQERYRSDTGYGIFFKGLRPRGVYANIPRSSLETCLETKIYSPSFYYLSAFSMD